MKRALLFMFAAFAGLNSFGQDTLSSRFANTHAQLDTIYTLIAISFPSSAHGYISGVNDQGRSKFAQLYETFNPTFNGHYGWTITGAISNWIGTASSTSGTNVTVYVWSVDSSDGPKQDVNGTDSVTGFPGAPLGSKSLAFSTASLNVNGNPSGYNAFPKHVVTTFTSPINVKAPFFLGVDFGSYTWATMGSDNMSLSMTANPSGTAYNYYSGLRERYYAHISPGPDTCFLSTTAYFDGTNWQDYYQKDGVLNALEIVPIVNQWNTDVPGITKNNLTFFGSYPNPATATANIKFSLAHNTSVSVEIMDITGRVLNTISENNLGTGEHIIPVNTGAMAAGEYIYMIKTTEGDAFASKLTVTK